MDVVSLLINTIAGAGGGYLGDMLKKNALGTVGNLIAGAIGGNAVPAALGALGVLGDGDGGGTNMIVNVMVALLGGGAGSLLGGLLKKA